MEVVSKPSLAARISSFDSHYSYGTPMTNCQVATIASKASYTAPLLRLLHATTIKHSTGVHDYYCYAKMKVEMHSYCCCADC